MLSLRQPGRWPQKEVAVSMSVLKVLFRSEQSRRWEVNTDTAHRPAGSEVQTGRGWGLEAAGVYSG